MEQQNENGIYNVPPTDELAMLQAQEIARLEKEIVQENKNLSMLRIRNYLLFVLDVIFLFSLIIFNIAY